MKLERYTASLRLRRKARIEMLPLIDIVFLLLVFFIYAMLSMAVHRGLPVVLPESRAAAVDTKDVLSVTLRADGILAVDEQEASPDELTGLLAARVRAGKEPAILLFADRAVSYQALFAVLDLIRESGIERISLQAEIPGNGSK